MKPVGTSARLPGASVIGSPSSHGGAQVHAGGARGFIGGQVEALAMRQADEIERRAGVVA